MLQQFQHAAAPTHPPSHAASTHAPGSTRMYSPINAPHGVNLPILPPVHSFRGFCYTIHSPRNLSLVYSICAHARVHGWHYNANKSLSNSSPLLFSLSLPVPLSPSSSSCIYLPLSPSLSLSLPPSPSLSQESVSYTCHVSGPGLTSATVNVTTQILVELTDSSGRPHPLPMNITAQLEPISKATPTNQQATPTRESRNLVVTVATPSRYEVTYTPVIRGRHKLHVQVNDKEINGSPFTVTVYPDPKQLGHRVRTVTGLDEPYGIAFNNREEMIVSECGAHRLSILDTRGQKIRTLGSRGDSPHQMIRPAGIATDDSGNIYVSSEHKLQKFTSTGELIKCVGQRGGKEGEFNVPRGLTLRDNLVYVCDINNNRIQVFDLDLNFVRSIGSRGSGRGEFDRPFDVKFDTAGNMYVAEWGNKRVQVMDSSGRFIREFGRGKLSRPYC